MKRPLGIVLSLALSLLLTLAGCSGGETASALPQAAEGTLSLAPGPARPPGGGGWGGRQQPHP